MTDTQKPGEQPINVTNVAGGHSEQVNLSMEEGRKPAADPNAPTAESLGVSAEQFAKYFDAKSGAYNWQAHAKEAEFKLTQKAPKAEAEGKADVKSEAEVSSIIDKAGLKEADLERMIIDNGDLGKAEYEALAKVGIPETLAREYVQNLVHRASSHVTTVINAFGGEDGFDAVRAFAQSTMTATEIEGFNKRLSDPSTFKAAVAEIKADMAAKNASGVQGVNRVGGGGTSVEGYATQADMVRDIRDPRYRADPKFRAEVTAKAAASKWQMNPRAHTSGV